MKIGYAVNMPKPVEYLFIDGAYLRKCLDSWSSKFFKGKPVELDFEILAKGFQKTFYYDCLSPQNKGENQVDYDNRLIPQKNFFNSLREHNGFHVYEGTTSGTGGRARQKQIDIMIAVHMLSHTIRGNMSKTTLLAGDLDFKPVVDALVQEGMYVTLWCEKRSTSRELLYSADSKRDFDLWYVWQSTTIKFRNEFPAPQRFIDSIKKIEGLKPIQEGTVNLGGYAAILYNVETKWYSIVYQDNNGRFDHIDHPDRKILELFLQDIGIEFQWNNRPL